MGGDKTIHVPGALRANHLLPGALLSDDAKKKFAGENKRDVTIAAVDSEMPDPFAAKWQVRVLVRPGLSSKRNVT